jgi:hypothetical protein
MPDLSSPHLPSSLSDPSELTGQLVLRENAWLQKLVDARFEGNDRAIKLLQDNANRTPTPGEMFVEFKERFRGIEKEFEAVRNLTNKLDEAKSKAIDAALQAAEKAVNQQQQYNLVQSAEIKASFSKQIDALNDSISTGVTALDNRLNDIKERLTLIEGRGQGLGNVGTFIVGAFGVIAVLVTIAVLLLEKH